MRGGKASSREEESSEGNRHGWERLNKMVRNARPTEEKADWLQLYGVYVLAVMLSAVIAVLSLAQPSICLMKTPRPSSELLIAIYQTTFAVTATTASIFIGIFYFAEQRAHTSLDGLEPVIERNLKAKFGRFLETDDQRDQKTWIELWRRLEHDREAGEIIIHCDWTIRLQQTASLVGRGVYLHRILSSLAWKTLLVIIPFGVAAASSILALWTLDPNTQNIRFEGVHLYVLFEIVLAYGVLAVYSWETIGGLWREGRYYFVEQAVLRGSKAQDAPPRAKIASKVLHLKITRRVLQLMIAKRIRRLMTTREDLRRKTISEVLPLIDEAELELIWLQETESQS